MHDDERLPDPILVDEEDEAEYPTVVSPLTSSQHRGDGPMGRITIDMIEIDELDQLVAALRTRRLERIETVRRLAQSRQFSDDQAELARFDKLLARIRASIEKMTASEAKIMDELNKLRVMATALEG